MIRCTATQESEALTLLRNGGVLQSTGVRHVLVTPTRLENAARAFPGRSRGPEYKAQRSTGADDSGTVALAQRLPVEPLLAKAGRLRQLGPVSAMARAFTRRATTADEPSIEHSPRVRSPETIQCPQRRTRIWKHRMF